MTLAGVEKSELPISLKSMTIDHTRSLASDSFEFPPGYWDGKRSFMSMNFFLKKLGRILTVFVLGAALLFTTACNNGDVRGARPENPPVQMGGGNNPYKQADGYTNYKMSTDARAKDSSKLRSSADSLVLGELIADRGIQSNADNLLYPGANAKRTDNPDIGPRGAALKPEPFPAQRQEVINRGNPDEKILEKIGQQFEDASAFIKDSLDEATETR